jgi:hypothetical protein
MIELPKRSVTRFFIPLIDVLILLFCIYLIMPIIKGPADSAAEGSAEEAAAGPLDERERQELRQLRKDAHDLQQKSTFAETERRELAHLKEEKQQPLERRLAIRVLEIDAATGKLFHYDPERVEISSEATARIMIARHRREAAGRELYYLFLFPRKLTGYPEERQVEQYQRWFTGVPHGFDNPQAGG